MPESTPVAHPWCATRMSKHMIGTAQTARLLKLSEARVRELDELLLPEIVAGRRLFRLDHVERVARERAKAGR